MHSSKFNTIQEMLTHLILLKKDWKALSFLLILFVSAVASEPYFYMWLVGGIEQKESLSYILAVVGLWGIVSFLTIFFRYFYGLRLLEMAVRDWQAFLMKIMRKMQSLPIEYHRNTGVGEKQKIVDRGSEAVWSLADNIVLVVLPQVCIIIILIVS